jgi:hypothetical protein
MSGVSVGTLLVFVLVDFFISGLDGLFVPDDEMLDEKFYTPKTSVKNKLDNKKEIQNKDIRKRILPVPPMQFEKPTTPSADHIRELKKVEMNKIRENAREKARLKSDEELGLENVNYTPIPAKKIDFGVFFFFFDDLSSNVSVEDDLFLSFNSLLCSGDLVGLRICNKDFFFFVGLGVSVSDSLDNPLSSVSLEESFFFFFLSLDFGVFATELIGVEKI